MSQPNKYYAYRKGADLPLLDYRQLRRLVCALFERLETEGWFQDSLGKDCPDAPTDIGGRVLLELGRDFWPLSDAVRDQKEEWLFTAIEFAFDHVAEPSSWWDHPWDRCGRHVTASDRAVGKRKYQELINEMLARYETRYWLADDGLVYELPPAEMEELETIEPAETAEPKIDDRVASARRAFRRYGATEDDKRHAVHDLADVFEHLRATTGTGLMSKDEAELFTIANTFGIRHHNPKQKNDYEAGPWLDWMYYAFLNSIHLVNRLRVRD